MELNKVVIAHSSHSQILSCKCRNIRNIPTAVNTKRKIRSNSESPSETGGNFEENCYSRPGPLEQPTNYTYDGLLLQWHAFWCTECFMVIGSCTKYKDLKIEYTVLFSTIWHTFLLF